ncbi:hypothetical protein BVRB_5g117750 [Beta vulgaris subsp. vulgaris]|uniref:oleosin H2 n=1 Tax=Beta vulgaris subsp. vulgaris TaxID=3555 RepID=UPI00053F67C4|nr:oleosin H2 [Beta vulgaris subsp. vulgaris]KMT10659.1 hypothetical protein BVRB_5g117750 [Beta vulgaris subsp. vulgaris]
MADTSQQHRQEIQQRSHEKGQDLQQRGQEAVHNFKQFLHENAPSSSNILAFLTVFPFGAFLLGLSGLAFIASLVGLALTIPLFILFSPVIVPAALTIGLSVLGFLSSGAFGLTGLSAFSWIINYLRGFRAGDTDMSMGHVTRWAHQKAGDMGQRIKEMGQDVSDRAREG